MLGPVNHRAFDDFAKNVAMIYIKNQLHSVKRTDIVWDQYFLDSLKKKMRNGRSRGVCRKVKPNGYLPNHWSTFLRCSENKTELFEFISRKLIKDIDLDKCLIVIFNDTVLKNQPIDLTDFCNAKLKRQPNAYFFMQKT